MKDIFKKLGFTPSNRLNTQWGMELQKKEAS